MSLYIERPAADRRATFLARGLLMGGVLAIASCLVIGDADARPGRGGQDGVNAGDQFRRGPGGPGERRGPPPGMGQGGGGGGQQGVRPPPPPPGGAQQGGGQQRPMGPPPRWNGQSRDGAAGSS